MASRILLISQNCCDQPYPVFPLGIGHLVAALEKAGHTTRVHDCLISDIPVERALTDFCPQVVGISVRNIDDVRSESRQSYFADTVALCQIIRRFTGCPIVLGGTAFSIFPTSLLRLTGADYGIHGPGEVAFNLLIEALATGADPSAIPGLVHRCGDEIIVNPRAPVHSEFFGPAVRPRDLVAGYLQRSSMLNITTQRGCNQGCCFCTYPLIEGRVNRHRPPDEIAEELAALQRQGARHVFIADAVFNLSNDHVTNVCEAILREGVQVTWTCFLRPRNLSRELLSLMVRAGLTHIEFGTDSFCDEVLVEYGKSFTFSEVVQSNELATAAGVHASHFVICGGVGETSVTLQTGYANSRRLTGATIFAFAGMRIYPGTALLARARREGLLTADINLLDPVYYISPALGEIELHRQLAGFADQSPNWIIGPVPPEFIRTSERLRRRGIVGPLWEYFTTLRRMN